MGYETYLNRCNRSRRKVGRVECECGKIVFETQLERHTGTDMHRRLMVAREKDTMKRNIEEEKKKQRRRELTDKVEEMLKELAVLNGIRLDMDYVRD